MSGTLRSTLDVFNEYDDAEIVRLRGCSMVAQSADLCIQYEALRRVHLIPAEGTAAEDAEAVNANVFRNLDSSVSEGGDNFSTG